MEPRQIYQRKLRELGLRLTDQRNKLFDVFLKAKSPLKISSVCFFLKEGVDSATVYRNIETFMDAGILKKTQTGFKETYELSEEFIPHHHHFTCLRCGKIIDFTEPGDLVESLNKVSEAIGARMQYHSVELSGSCEDCS